MIPRIVIEGRSRTLLQWAAVAALIVLGFGDPAPAMGWVMMAVLAVCCALLLEEVFHKAATAVIGRFTRQPNNAPPDGRS